MTISLRAAHATNVGDVSLFGNALVSQGDTSVYQITDYNSFSVYTVETSVGTISILDDSITLVMPPTTSETQLTINVIKDGRPNYFVVAIGAESIAAPIITSPLNNATSVSLSVSIQTDGFSTVPAGQDTHASTNWQIATDNLFTNLVVNVSSDTVNKLVFPVPSGVLQINTAYYVRASFNGNVMGVSPWSAPVKFTTRSQYIQTPNLVVEGGPDVVGETPSLSGSAFTVLGGGSDVHATSDWQIVDVLTSAIVWQSLGNSVNKTSIRVPSGILEESKQYTARLRYSGQSLGNSSWAESTFTTVQRFAIGKYLAKFRYSNNLDVYAIDGTNPILLTSMVNVQGVRWSKDGRWLVVATGTSSRYMVQVYERSGDSFNLHKTLINVTSFAEAKYSIVFTPDDSELHLAGSGSSQILRYSVSSGEFTQLANYSLPGSPLVSLISYNYDGTLMAAVIRSTAGADLRIRLYNVVVGGFTLKEEVANSGTSSSSPDSLVWSPTENTFVSSSPFSYFHRVFSVPSSGSTTVVYNVPTSNNSFATMASFDKTGNYLVVGVESRLSNNLPTGYVSLIKKVSNTWQPAGAILTSATYPMCLFSPEDTLYLSNGSNWTINSFDPLSGTVTLDNQLASTGWSSVVGSWQSQVWPTMY